MSFDEISRPGPGPAPDHLTVTQAAERLSVGAPRVLRLIASGELPATKVGRQWFIPAAAVDLRRAVQPDRGRRFSPAAAWGLLFMAAGNQAPWLTPQQRWRLRQYLASSSVSHLRSRLSTRGRARFFHAHPGLFSTLREDRALMLTGASAASELRLGLIGGGDRVDAYVDADHLEAVVRRHHLRPSSDANVTLRVVPSFGWAWPPARVAPIPAIALDLLDDPEPRSQQVGGKLLDGIIA